MCKTVYLTSKRFDAPSKKFVRALSEELKIRGVEVYTDNAYDFFNLFRKHKTYGIAIAVDFFKDKQEGCGLTLNKSCSAISRDFAYSISNNLDLLMPMMKWRDFQFVCSDDKDWFKFFNKISSETKAIFHLCTYNNPSDFENYLVSFNGIVKTFADEILRCLRSDYNRQDYNKRVKISRMKITKAKQK